MNRAALGLISFLGLLFLVSLTVWFVDPVPLTRYVMAFPDTAGGCRHHEFRYLPRRQTTAGAVTLFLEELVLGPADIGAIPFLPKETKVNGVILGRDGRLFVDLSSDVMFSRDRETVIEDISHILLWNIRFNFPSVKELVLTVDGQVPGFPPIFAD